MSLDEKQKKKYINNNNINKKKDGQKDTRVSRSTCRRVKTIYIHGGPLDDSLSIRHEEN